MKLGLIIAYYPSRIPDTQGRFPSSVQALVHIAGQEVGVAKHSQMVGIQGKRRVVKRNIGPGIGLSKMNTLAYPIYMYSVQPGFAEHDLDEYEKVSAELAWSRSLAAARKAFNQYTNMEIIVDQNVQGKLVSTRYGEGGLQADFRRTNGPPGKFFTREASKVISSYATNKTPHVTHLPTLTGGVGIDELQRFYEDYFITSNPPSTTLTLVSRTVGADRIADEVHLRFKSVTRNKAPRTFY